MSRSAALRWIPSRYAIYKKCAWVRNEVFFIWRAFWLRRSGYQGMGRFAAWLASLNTDPYHDRAYLAGFIKSGFVAPSARVSHSKIEIGSHVYIGDRVLISERGKGGSVALSDHVHLYGESFIETGLGGQVHIGLRSHVQPGCHIHSFISNITIGSDVEVAACCSFYNYNHGIHANSPIMNQPLVSRGNILVGDGVWIGHGVVVLQGVTVGNGAVIAAGAVVTNDIPDNAIAAGVPARIIGYRESQ